MEAARWDRLMGRLSLPPCPDTFEALCRRYAERHRHYHTAAHIGHCLTEFDRHAALARSPDDVELALWFHDAVYNPYAGGNEAKSADWASRFLLGNGAGEARADRVHALILATMHDAPVSDPDARLLVDVDLAILGADDGTFQRFEHDVRREYRWIPGPVFRRARRRILQSFLDSESVYLTEPMRQRYEASARENLRKAVAALAV